MYEGDYLVSGEMQTTPGLQRFWPDFASLTADPLFTHYAELLYRPLLEAAQRT